VVKILSPLKSIRKYCLSCCLNQANEVTLCDGKSRGGLDHRGSASGGELWSNLVYGIIQAPQAATLL
jgi:hypothetical protein